MNEKNKLTPLSELGEFLLIDKLTKNNVTINKSTKKSIGDDGAVIQYSNEYQTVMSNDLLVEGIHFDLSYAPLKYVGYKAVVVNLSDIYAMNAIPEQILVSIAVSNRFSFEALDELYKGIYEACKVYNVDLVGGDTTSSKLGMTISVTAIGKAKSEKLTYRSGAKAGDFVCVSGNLGAAYMGLQVLERERKVAIETNTDPDWKDKDYVIQRQLRPEARRDIVEFFHKWDILPTSMMDVSDGLSSEILHICNQSKCGAKLNENQLPINEQTFNNAMEMNLIPTTVAMNGGEDYELLFTVNEKDVKKLSKNDKITIIGEITADKSEIELIANDGTPVPISAQGWNALRKNEE